ncbi:MAG: thiamine-phosphate kinase [Acidobacteriia bacterium]|nr:thiamine-phosphate kinase [Methyloceanibacter sp.]MCL6493117.1 thiamine-phosphate kinase [Terriglobia bacterium]
MSAAPLPAEFVRIARYFAPLAGPGGLALADDAALLRPRSGHELLLSLDTLVAGVHFLPQDPPDQVAKKLLRVNLSDLAAKGARPVGYLLSVSVPRDLPEEWFAHFSNGLAEDQARFGLALLGGDTTSTPGPISLSLTILGEVPEGQMVRRTGAEAGDEIYVTGTIGDAALGLAVLQGRLADPSGTLVARYRLPEPRLGLKLWGTAHAAIDISDGLLQDLGHLCRAAGLGAEIEAARVPLSLPARKAVDANPDWLATCLTGGDDYELALAVPERNGAKLAADAQKANVPVTRIGHFVAGPPQVTVRDAAGAALVFARGGWSHF